MHSCKWHLGLWAKTSHFEFGALDAIKLIPSFQNRVDLQEPMLWHTNVIRKNASPHLPIYGLGLGLELRIQVANSVSRCIITPLLKSLLDGLIQNLTSNPNPSPNSKTVQKKEEQEFATTTKQRQQHRTTSRFTELPVLKTIWCRHTVEMYLIGLRTVETANVQTVM